MAEFFAFNGWNDILVAFVFNHREIKAASELNKKINLYLLADSVETIRFLSKNAKQYINLYIKIDTGNRRTGIDVEDYNSIDTIVDEIKKHKNINFIGFLGHCGHTYFAKSNNEILTIWDTSLEKLNLLKKRYISYFPELIISLGDTPSCNLLNNFYEVDEIRPGNFVYNDLMQAELGTCNYKNIAAIVACPVVAVYKKRNEFVIYGGAIHFSKEYITGKNGEKVYGIVSKIQNGYIEPINDCYIASLTQEHGVVYCNHSIIKTINIGDIVNIIPVHSCLTSHQLLNSTFYI